ncbi:MAG: hypothetical protein FWH19_05470 [Treponema sp.]|nr:hypothetical protein [Treponema sp.]
MEFDKMKDKINEKLNKETLEAGKEKAREGAEKLNEKIKGLAFRGMLEKNVSAETRAKFPVLDKIIPLTNYIACGLAVLLVVIVVSNAVGGGGGALANTTWSGSYTTLLGDTMEVSFNFDKNIVRETARLHSSDPLWRAVGGGTRNGTYRVSGNKVTITWDDDSVSEGTIVGNSLSVSGRGTVTKQ